MLQWVHYKNKIINKTARGRIFFSLAVLFFALFFSVNLAHSQSLTTTDLGIGSDLQGALGASNSDIRVTIAKIIRQALSFLGIVAVLITLYGGFLYLTSGGSDEKVSKGKKVIINGFIGLAIILSSYALTSFVISRLVDATGFGGPGGGGGPGPCVGPGCNPFTVNQFGVRSLPPAMTHCIKNIKLAIVFSLPVNLSTVNDTTIQVRDAGGASVPGAWTFGPNQNTILFTPNGSCNPSPGSDCFAPNSPYTLNIINALGITSQVGNPALTLNCTLNTGGFVGCDQVAFTSGSAVDRTPPTITITAPPSSSAFEIGSTVNVNLTYTDDNGVQNTSLFVSNPSGGAPLLVGTVTSAQCNQTGNLTIPWNTLGYSAGNYTLTANTLDFAGQAGSDTANYLLRPTHCFNGILETNLGEQQLGPPECGGVCGLCAGANCTLGTDCASGVCTNGRCINAMAITGFSPSSGAPGTFVSVFGRYFGTTTGQIYFSRVLNPNPANLVTDWIAASPPAACGAGFNYWANNQIVVGSPLGAHPSSSILVITAPRDNGSGVVATERDLTSNHGLPVFQTNSILRPGLCSITTPNPPQGFSGDIVSLTGVHFGGTIDATSDNVKFGSLNAQVVPGPAWTDTNIAASVPGIDYGGVGVKVVNNGVESNSLLFNVVSGLNSTYPIIESISASTGTRGEYLTITGRNFGTLPGTVSFRTAPNGPAILGDFNFPPECRSSVWSDTRIIVKASPASTGANVLAVGSTYYLQVTTGDTASRESPYDSRISFAVQAGSPRPGICLITPSSLPATQLASTTIPVSIWGEYFTLNQSAAYFWGPSATNPNLTTGRPTANPVGFPAPTAGHLTVVPPNTTLTGPVSVARTIAPGDNKISNNLNFAVQNCIDPGVTCSAGTHCCSEGTQIGACISDGQVCNGATRSTGYVWRFSTRDIPEQPSVVERCDYATEAGTALPSPSPAIQWEASNTGDSYRVCQTALSTVEFSSDLTTSSVSNTSVRVYQCASYTNNVCNTPSVIGLNPSSYTVRQASTDHDYIQIRPSTPWAANTWYEVALFPTITGNSPGVTLPLSASRPCTTPNGAAAYCFVFQGGGVPCNLRAVVVTPYRYFTERLEAPLKDFSGNNIIYRGLGLSDQRCIMMDTSGLSWAWNSQNPTYANISGPSTAETAFVSSLANTVGIGLPGDAADIRATATITGAGARSLSGLSPLTIDLTNPRVIDWWPKCQSACLNTGIGVKFNTLLSNHNLNQPQTVRLLKCTDENCLGTTRVGGMGNYTLQDNSIIFTTGNLYDSVKGINLVKNGFADSGDNTNFSGGIYSQDTHAGAGSFYRVGGQQFYATDDAIPIDQNKTYLFELWAKTGNSDGSGYVAGLGQYAGVVPLDIDGNWIFPYMYTKCPGAQDTTLAMPLVPGASQIQLTDATGWYQGNQGYLRQMSWYPYTNARGTSYPNYTYTRNSSRFLSGYYPGGAWPQNGITGNTITLTSTWSGPSLPAGTAVRNECGGTSYVYLGPTGAPVSNVWTRYSNYFAGSNVASTPYFKLPYGTASVKLIFLTNYLAPINSPNIIRFSDIWLSDPSSTSTPLHLLEPNSLYKISLSAYNANPLTATNNIWTRANSTDMTSYSRPYNQEFSWRFKTKNDTCEVSRVEVTPFQYTAVSVSERAIYQAQAFSSPDTCDIKGQPIDAWGIPWSWSSSDNNVATVSSFATRGKNLYCTDKCVLRGSLVPYSNLTVPSPICGNNIIEAGEDCDEPNILTGCALNCRFIGNSGTCGNGTVDQGEACDPNNAATRLGCGIDCRNLGSLSGVGSTATSSSICGNGTIGSGEDCDTGITASSTNRRSALNCSAECLHIGSPISARWCMDHQADRGGFTVYDFQLACIGSVSRCGDGITGPDEDTGCEIGGGQHASWCNDMCLSVSSAHPNMRCTASSTSPTGFSEGCDKNGQLMGSSLLYSVPSSCGNSLTEIGEETFCETNLVNNPHVGIDPWALAVGVGRGVASGNPPAQRTVISATTPAGASTISGTGQFNIACGYHSDAECSVLNTATVIYGVGSDSCCYARPAIQAPTIPANNAAHVCLNTAISVNFNGLIDSSSLTGVSSTNIVIARGDNSLSCAPGESNVTSLVSNSLDGNTNNIAYQYPWYVRVLNVFKNLIIKFFDLNDASAAPGFALAQVRTWCASPDRGSFSVIETSTTTSRLSVALNRPLAADSYYSIIFKDGIRSTKGVSIGRTAANRNYSFVFSTDNAVCEINSVTITPAAWYFSSVGATTTLRAEASSSRGPIQPIAGMYAWNFVWGPATSSFVNLANTNFASTSLVTALNRNGELDIRAMARITSNIISSATGTVASGASHITVFLCENPWPPKFVNNIQIFPYNDSNTNHSGFNLSTGLFDGSAIPPSDVIANVGYFNFSTYYCADNGSFGKFDDLPYLKAAVQNTAVTLSNNNGVCEFSGDSCRANSDCGYQYNLNPVFVAPNSVTSVCGAVVSGNNVYYLSSSEDPLSCASVASCVDANYDVWLQGNGGVRACLALPQVAPQRNQLTCYINSPLKRFIFTNEKNTDGIGVQIFPNPKHLSAMDWYSLGKAAGGQGFVGQVRQTTIGGYEAVTDSNNYYVSAMNYDNVSGQLYDVVYLFSINSDAKPETRTVFEQMVKNFLFNTNLTHNDGYCGVDINTPNYLVQCSSDLDCPSGEVCSNQVQKLQRNHQRLIDLKRLDEALTRYYLAYGGSYPNLKSGPRSVANKGVNSDSYFIAANTYPGLKAGTYLAGQSVSTWPSWELVGKDLQISTPVDPVNQLAAAGSCFNQRTFCVNNLACGGSAPPAPCGLGPPCAPGSVCLAGSCITSGEICNNGLDDDSNSLIDCADVACAADSVCTGSSNPATTCTHHDSVTGWSTTDRRFSFACNINSLAYRYLSDTGLGFIIRSRFEYIGAPINNLPGFIDGYNFSNLSRFPNITNWTGQNNTGICENNTEISTSNPGTCGDGVINRQQNEECDPPGSAVYDKSGCVVGGGNATVITCSATCRMGAPQTVTCLSLAKCGNSIVEPGEVCDDGQLNGRYNQCNTSCTGQNTAYNAGNPTGSPGYCGDGAVNPRFEVCDVAVLGVSFYNLSENLSCAADCQSHGSFCGDGITDIAFGEICDVRNLNGVACVPTQYNTTCTYCNAVCRENTAGPLNYCGDGRTDVGFENCDDNNISNGDGCSSTCNEETNWTCTNAGAGTISTCTANSQVVSCAGLPSNAVWNTASQVTQTWNGTSWQPSNVAAYNVTPGTCRFTCSAGYNWNGSDCISVCAGVVCVASDQCHDVGVCNLLTGVCSNPIKANGSTCNDGINCTSADICTAGVCGGTPYTCAAPTGCQATNTCNGLGGCTPTYLPNGSACGSTVAGGFRAGSCSANVCDTTCPYSWTKVGGTTPRCMIYRGGGTYAVAVSDCASIGGWLPSLADISSLTCSDMTAVISLTGVGRITDIYSTGHECYVVGNPPSCPANSSIVSPLVTTCSLYSYNATCGVPNCWVQDSTSFGYRCIKVQTP